ncbi:MAG: hypothetical protein OER87_10735 [Gammaproteobacteria bacterium]|nr:hypothetical protein [Gammaproteobacteria bacterium]
MAEHEVDHRYNIRGYVLDDQKQAIINQDVLAYDGDSLLVGSKTDSDGYYSMHLHLHNEDRGKKIRIRAGSSEAEIRVTFDPADDTTLRIHDANLVGGKLVEGSLGRFRMPPWVYPLAGLLVTGFLLVMLEKRRRKKLKQKQPDSAGKQHRSSHRGKNRKSKKR